MSQALVQPSPTLISDFDRFVEAPVDATEFELVDGAIVMMANPTETDELIARNIGAPLKLAMDARQCRTYQGAFVFGAPTTLGTSIKRGLMSSSGAVPDRGEPTSPIRLSS